MLKLPFPFHVIKKRHETSKRIRESAEYVVLMHVEATGTVVRMCCVVGCFPEAVDTDSDCQVWHVLS